MGEYTTVFVVGKTPGVGILQLKVGSINPVYRVYLAIQFFHPHHPVHKNTVVIVKPVGLRFHLTRVCPCNTTPFGFETATVQPCRRGIVARSECPNDIDSRDVVGSVQSNERFVRRGFNHKALCVRTLDKDFRSGQFAQVNRFFRR